MNKIGIYVHIPFCLSKCNYCNFISSKGTEEEKKEYFSKLIKEIESFKTAGDIVTTVYIGGGTPSCVDEGYIKKILETIRNKFKVIKNAEITIECNPISSCKEKFECYKKAGINRVSFGVQSLYQKDLIKLNRKQSDPISSIKTAKAIGIENINADLLLGLEKQTFLKVKMEVRKLIKAGVKHLSCYMLINEEGTILNNMIREKKYVPLDEGKTVRIYNKLLKYLRRKGFYRYEVSNFSKKGYECKHNINTWKCSEYLGFGLASHSYYNGIRFNNSERLKDYLDDKKGEIYKLSKREKAEEFIMLGLRLDGGINLVKYKTLFGEDLLEKRKDEINEMIDGDFIEIVGNVLKVKNFGILNLIIVKLI